MGIGIGCSCHCSQPATLWKILCATGEVIWQADRIPLAPAGRGRSTGLDLYHDGTDLWIYESGGMPVEGGNNVTKWRDAGDEAERQWAVLAERGDSSDYWDAVRRAEDGSIWWIPPYTGSSLVDDAWRLDDADGAYSASGDLVNSGPTHIVGSQVWPAPTSGMFVATLAPGSGVLRGYDNSFANTVTQLSLSGIGAAGHFAPIEGLASLGFISRMRDIFDAPDRYQVLTPALTQAMALNATTLRVVTNSSAFGKFLASSATVLQCRDSATLALDWSATISDGWFNSRPTLARVDSSGDAYILQGTTPVGSSAVTVAKISGGTVEWEYDSVIDSPGFAAGLAFSGMTVDEESGFLLLYGDSYVIDGEYFQVIALSLDDGTLQWSVNLGSTVNVRSVNAGQLYGDHLYVCGDKM